jgi:hypothetical protein
MPNGPVDQRCEDNRCIDERTELDRRRVAVCEHDEHLRKELRNSDTDQVDPGPWLERAPACVFFAPSGVSRQAAEVSERSSGLLKMIANASIERLQFSSPLFELVGRYFSAFTHYQCSTARIGLPFNLF